MLRWFIIVGLLFVCAGLGILWPGGGCVLTDEDTPLPEGYTLSVNVQGQGTVRPPDNSTYKPGVRVTLTAIPDAGWQLVQWQGDAGGTEEHTHPCS